ncbi:MAG: hypothetical protein OXN17_23030 [Candidatus Poribacteria bacterium]|nr:hypothetical protein [Candidatus Poribacteria bacterium]MDE0504217.1 hypothetical protein [Candidatus Poribacteria bacterium]
MDLQQINIKVFVTADSNINYQNFIKVFNRWMEEADQDDYLNYADYSHTSAGPGVLLISKRANYSIDNAMNRHGFLYNRKHKLEGENREKIRQAFVEAFNKCQRLEKAEELENEVHFRGDEILFMINNRNITSNSPEMFEAIKSELTPVLEQMYGSSEFTLERASEDERERFAIRISASSHNEISELLTNLEIQ